MYICLKCGITSCTFDESIILFYVFMLVDLYAVSDKKFRMTKLLGRYPNYIPERCRLNTVVDIFDRRCMCNVSQYDYKITSLLDVAITYMVKGVKSTVCKRAGCCNNDMILSRIRNIGVLSAYVHADELYVDMCLFYNMTYNDELSLAICDVHDGIRLYQVKLLLCSPCVSEVVAFKIIIDMIHITLCRAVTCYTTINVCEMIEHVLWSIQYIIIEYKYIKVYFLKDLIGKIDNNVNNMKKIEYFNVNSVSVSFINYYNDLLRTEFY